MRNNLEGRPKGNWLALVGALALLAAMPVIAADRVAVRYFAQGKKVIPVYCGIGNWEISDIKLPDLVVTNRESIPIVILRVDVIGKSGGHQSEHLRISGEELDHAIGDVAARVNGGKPLQTIQLSFGDVQLPAGRVSSDRRARPGQSIILPLSEIAYLHHIGQTKLDGMAIRLAYKAGPNTGVINFPVVLTRYESKVRYRFPVSGDVQLAFLPLSYIHHRACTSQEFAMDVVAANQAGAANFTQGAVPDPKTLGDYGIWRRDVFAMGDGVVFETGGNFPEDRMSDPALFTQPSYVTALLQELIPTIGWTNAVAGNYVIVDHQNGEFSAYCHLHEGSIRVRAGDRVTRGQVIAQVGNTGNSGAPHLHFQLMDSGNFFTANGLPALFENLPEQIMVNEYPVTANTLSFSDGVFVAVP